MSAKHNRQLLEFDPSTDPPLPTRANVAANGFLHPLGDAVGILGVTFHEHVALDEHMRAMTAKAQQRKGILTKKARSKWGPEASILRVTHNALKSSLLCYARAATGSYFLDDLVNLIDTAAVNTASRRITGARHSTRIEILHFQPGTYYFRNL